MLIGRGTFSSAMLNAWQLRRETSALLVGLPTGGCPNSPGEVRSEVLPHCGWHVQYSTKWFELSDTQMQIRLGSFRFRIPTGQGGLNRDAATAVMPDLEIDWSSADYFSGRDPVLQAALDYPR